MPSLWIVHRSPRLRAALERIAGLATDVVSGEPGATAFGTAAPPDVVLLGLGAGLAVGDQRDWESELAFASQIRRRAPGALWILTGPRAMQTHALELFDNVRLEYHPYPPDRDLLNARLAEAGPAPALASLSERATRDALAARFARWYGDLDLPDVLRALDPNLASVPVLIRGEPGTGRGLLVRYLHAFGLEGAALVHVPCHASLTLPAIERIVRATEAPGGVARSASRGMTLWLQSAEQLPEQTQHQLEAWIQGVAAPRGIRAPFVRFVATTTPRDAPQQLHPGLRELLGVLGIELPPLRERSERIGAIATETLAAWCRARRLPPRHFDAESLALLEQSAWPGNLRELEGVVMESAVSAPGDAIASRELRSGGRPLTPRAAPTPAAPRTPSPPPEPAPAAPASPERRGSGDSLRREERAGNTPPAPETPPAQPARESVSAPPPLARLAAAFSREIRAPLERITELAKAEHLEEASLREELGRALQGDAGQVERLLERIEALGSRGRPRQEPVDVVALLDQLLEPHEETIRARRLLVLKELDATHSLALADPDQLRLALAALVDKAFALVPDRGDLYVASRHHAGRSGADTIRILIRFHSPDRTANLPLLQNSLEVVVVESVIQSMRGRVAVSATESEEALILLDLPAAP